MGKNIWYNSKKREVTIMEILGGNDKNICLFQIN